MAKKQKQKIEIPADNPTAIFSIIQLDVDQGPPVPTQRVLQVVMRDGETKQYVTESSYFRGELMEFFAVLVSTSYEKSIMRKLSSLKPIDGQKYWVHFNSETTEGKRQPRVSPEAFE